MTDGKQIIPHWWLELFDRVVFPEMRGTMEAPAEIYNLDIGESVLTEHFHCADMVLGLGEHLNSVYVWKNRWGDRNVYVHVSAETYVELERLGFSRRGLTRHPELAGHRLVFLTSMGWVRDRFSGRH